MTTFLTPQPVRLASTTAQSTPFRTAGIEFLLLFISSLLDID
jgi:hypothetical protein